MALVAILRLVGLWCNGRRLAAFPDGDFSTDERTVYVCVYRNVNKKYGEVNVQTWNILSPWLSNFHFVGAYEYVLRFP